MLYAPFKSHMAKYSQYETTQLSMDLSSVLSPQSKDIIDELRHLSASVPKILDVYAKASTRCCDLTEGNITNCARYMRLVYYLITSRLCLSFPDHGY